MDDQRRRSSSLNNIASHSSDVKRRIFAKNEAQNKILQLKLMRLKKEHQKSISKIDDLIAEDLEQLRRVGSDMGKCEEEGRRSVHERKDGMIKGKSNMFPSLEGSKSIDMGSRAIASETNHGLAMTPRGSKLSGRGTAVRKNEEHLVNAFRKVNQSFDSERQRFFVQKPPKTETDDDEEQKTKKINFVIPIIVISAPGTHCQTSIRDCQTVESSKSEEFKQVLSLTYDEGLKSAEEDTFSSSSELDDDLECHAILSDDKIQSESTILSDLDTLNESEASSISERNAPSDQNYCSLGKSNMCTELAGEKESLDGFDSDANVSSSNWDSSYWSSDDASIPSHKQDKKTGRTNEVKSAEVCTRRVEKEGMTMDKSLIEKESRRTKGLMKNHRQHDDVCNVESNFIVKSVSGVEPNVGRQSIMDQDLHQEVSKGKSQLEEDPLVKLMTDEVTSLKVEPCKAPILSRSLPRFTPLKSHLPTRMGRSRPRCAKTSVGDTDLLHLAYGRPTSESPRDGQRTVKVWKPLVPVHRQPARKLYQKSPAGSEMDRASGDDRKRTVNRFKTRGENKQREVKLKSSSQRNNGYENANNSQLNDSLPELFKDTENRSYLRCKKV